MTKQPKPCTWDGERWTTPDELPCNEDHCAMRGRCPGHVNHDAGIITCPRCIRRVRKDIDTIVERTVLLAFDAEIDGVESEAMNLIGHAAAPRQYAEKRRRLAEHYDAQGWCEWPRSEGYRPDDPHHPYAVLTSWAQAMEDGGWLPVHPFHWTTTRAATAILGALDRFAHGDEFETFAAEIARCRKHLDDVDHDSRTPDLGRPCPTCVDEHGKGPKLRKRHATHPGSRPGQRCSDRLCAICNGHADAWHCPDNPAHAWTDAEYRDRVDADYLEHADHLPAREVAQRAGVPLSQVRKWCARTWDEAARKWLPPALVSRRKGADGRKLYRVAEVVALTERERMSV